MSKGKNRDWGYASYDIDDGSLSYTSYEKSGKVNKYHDNGDGGHSHEFWGDKDDYNSGYDSDEARYESGDSRNPEDDSGCFLTTACMKYLLKDFNDDCTELTILRYFRDNYVKKEDVKHYYEIAPKIVEIINKDNEHQKIYTYIYENVILECIEYIKDGKYKEAYDLYKSLTLELENLFLNNTKTLRMTIN